MVICSECQKSNTLDSQYCRSCGHALPIDLLTEARKANDELVTEGFKLLAETRHDEALLVAQSALEVDPSHVQALSLKGDVLERQGHLAEALVCYEKVVELTPSSTLDRIKVDHVRRMLSHAAEAVVPNRRNALAAAMAATALVACIGIATTIVILNRAPAATTSTNPNKIVADTFPAGSSDSSVPQAKPVSREEFERLKREAEAERARQPASAPTNTQANSNGRLPNAQNNGDQEPLEGTVRPLNSGLGLTPINPNPPSQPAAQPTSRPNSVDPDPTPNNGSGNATRPPERTTPQGTVDIRPTPGGPERVGGSEVIAENNNAGSSWRDIAARARQFFNSGDYAKAADAYERALAAGANPATTNQRLGQCYQRLGRKADAIRAYENAVRYFTAQLQSNPSDDSIKTALDACNQAVANLRG